MKMEIMVGDADGGHARAITNFGCASFAPTFTPDGKTLVFCSDRDAKDRYEFKIFTAAWRD
jgi:Tol biopolymer transport system component